MITKNKFHLLVAVLAILSLFAPVQFVGGLIWAVEYYLLGGTLSLFTEYRPLVIWPVFILYNYAIFGLIVWSFLLLSTKSINWYRLYRVWLLSSLISSLLMNIHPGIDHGDEIGVWLNPSLLLLATVGEFWTIISDQRNKPNKFSTP